ncbi:hypothetical protein [Bacillus atrophaeus]
MLTGSTVFEYIRRRRLTLAAQELAAFKANVIDVALKFGHNSDVFKLVRYLFKLSF